MNYGPLVFLAAFFALASSWCGFVLTPQLQIGRLQQTNTVGGAAAAYPVARPGLAQQGMEVYRANGCAYCHSEQVGQTRTMLDIALTDAGTNQSATIAALLKLVESSPDQPARLTLLLPLQPGASNATSATMLEGLPKAFLRSSTREAANVAIKTLNATSAKAQLWIVPVGPDLARGWGKRRSVAEDFLFDATVMPGSQRVGPDLANIAARLPDANWHLRHLYAPRLEVKGSSMPPYRFLFAKRKVGDHPSLDALVLPPDLAPGAGYEIVPKPAAKALAAYLINRHADAPLFDAPRTLPASAGTLASTNAPVVSGVAPTNAAPTNAPAK
jgi:cbb3-type cytochrome oxidase cytochrome c subunit